MKTLPTPLYLTSLAVTTFLVLIATDNAVAQFTTILNIPPDPNIGDNQSIGSNTQLNLSAGGTVGTSFAAGVLNWTTSNIEVNITGGQIAPSFEANAGSVVNLSSGVIAVASRANAGSVVNVSGGYVGPAFDASGGSVINISGGVVDERFQVFNGGVVNISGGEVDNEFQALPGSRVNISGGSVGDNFEAQSGSVVNFSGGSIGNYFWAHHLSEVNLFGSSFVLDGNVLDSLIPGQAFTITDRDVTLEGILADGSPFSFDLNRISVPYADEFDDNATLTVTLVPEPNTFVLIALAAACFPLVTRRKKLRAQCGMPMTISARISFLLVILSPLTAHAELFTQPVSLPSSPVTVASGSPLPLSVDFGVNFSSVDFVRVHLEFLGDLWDDGENWFITGMGGQENLGGGSRSSATLQSPHASTTNKFLDGLHDFDLSIFPGAAGIASLEFELEGVPAFRGDYDHDGFVGSSDLAVWEATFGQQGEGLFADGNLDGNVDGVDFLIWQRNRSPGIDPCPGGGACVLKAVPEPSSLLLIGIAVGRQLLRRRR